MSADISYDRKVPAVPTEQLIEQAERTGDKIVQVTVISSEDHHMQFVTLMHFLPNPGDVLELMDGKFATIVTVRHKVFKRFDDQARPYFKTWPSVTASYREEKDEPLPGSL